MPFFLILPLFLAWVASLIVAILASFVHPPAARHRPYFVAILGWSTLGFVLSTILYTGVMIAALLVMERVLAGPSTIGGIAMGLVVFVGPFLATGVGVLDGTAVEVRRTRRRTGMTLTTEQLPSFDDTADRSN